MSACEYWAVVAGASATGIVLSVLLLWLAGIGRRR